MSEFLVLGHSGFFAVRWHKVSEIRYWDAILSCGQPAEPGSCLASGITGW